MDASYCVIHNLNSFTDDVIAARAWEGVDLLDEPIFGIGFNNDGDTFDLNVSVYVIYASENLVNYDLNPIIETY